MMQEQNQKLVSAFLWDFARKLGSASWNDYDLTHTLPSKEAWREFMQGMATYFNLEEYFEALEEDPDYDETVINDSMLAEYLAFLLDSSIEQNSSSSQLDIE